MINLNAYKDWKDLFDEHVSKVWQEESVPVLKKLTMMLFSIKKEIKKIEDEVEMEVSNLRENIIKAEQKQIVISNFQSKGNNNNKENVLLKNTETRFSQSKSISKNITVDSPEMFQNNEPTLSGSNDSGSIVISDDDGGSYTLTNGSPEIKKKKRWHAFQKRSQRMQKLRDSSTPTINLLGSQSSQENNDNSSQRNNDNKKLLSLTDEKSSLDFFKELIVHTQKLEGAIKDDSRLLHGTENSDVTTGVKKAEDLVLTPVRNVCDIDLSIVQCTPVPISLPKRKEKMPSYFLKKKSRREKGNTLTQMLSRNESRKHKEKDSRMGEVKYDSDETCFNPSCSSKASETGSVMGLTRMVSYLNKNSHLTETDKIKTETDDQEVVNLDPDTQEIANIVEDIRFEDFEDDNSLNSAIVKEEKENGEAEVSQKLNEFLAKAQHVPEYQLEAEPVVRGKARQKLPGWACKDCEKFYLKQGFNADDILALNKCSKHRGYYRPREDTLPGFWDMNISSQETQNAD